MAIEEADLEAIQRRVEERREQHLARLGERPLQWLALFPEWTVALAERAAFPVANEGSVRGWVQVAEMLRYCVTGPPVDLRTDPSDRFWMAPDVRSTVVTRWRTAGKDLLVVAREIAMAVDTAVKQGGLDMAPSQWAWLDLARQPTAQSSADLLLRRVRELLDQGWASQVNGWTCAGEWFESVAGAEMASAVRRAKRLLALHYRALHDREVVRDYYVRRDQVAAFDRLLRSPDIWALHYVGQGGVGKTSLIRYLSAMRGQHGAGPTFARVDFDYVSPDYPWRRPGQLLVELADELDMAVVEADQERLSRAFRKQERRVTEALSGVAQLELRADSPEMEAAYDTFAGLIAHLPPPVVFVLDTCEELAKFHPPGAPVESVHFTFEIMERIHARVPSLRVVFAGRRLLTDGGAPTAGWEIYDPSQARAVTGPRRYLDLFEIRGFTSAEAREYLRTQPAISVQTTEAILKASETTERTPGLRPDGEDDLRHSPFEVALYARWATTDTRLGADLIEGDKGTRYIEARIVDRLEPELREAIGPVVALGRFNADLLAYAVRSKDMAERVFERLLHQEWTEVVTDRTGTVVQVKPTVLGKLRAYLETLRTAPGGDIDAVLDQLKRNLPEHIRQTAVSEITASTARAGLCLTSEPDGLVLWGDVEFRIGEEGEWLAAERLCESLLATEEEGGIPESRVSLRAAVATTAAAAAGHLGRATAPALWRLAGKALDDQDAGLSPRLRARIQAGLALDAPLDDAIRLLAAASSAYEAAEDDEIAAALCGPLERVLDQAVVGGADLRPLRDFEWFFPDLVEPERFVRWLADSAVRVELCLLAGRLRASDPSKPWFAAAKLFAAAERAAPLVAAHRARWLQWSAPASLVDRSRLVWLWAAVEADERVTADPYSGSPDADPEAWALGAAERLETLDAERLVSLVLEVKLASGIASGQFVTEIGREEKYRPRPASSLLHRSIPPLFVTLARAFHALDEADRALELLFEYSEAATGTRADPTTVDWANRGIIDLARVERRPPGSVLDRLAADSQSPLNHRAALVQLVLRGTGDDGTHLGQLLSRLAEPHLTQVELHRIWQLVSFRNRDDLGKLARAWLDVVANSSVSHWTPELSVDLAEAMSLEGTPSPAEGLIPPYTEVSEDDVLWKDARVRAELRAAALDDRPIHMDTGVRARRDAELAFEEADLLALRLPGPAARLYLAAGTEFSRRGDPLNGSRALVAAALARIQESGQVSRIQRRSTVRPAARILGHRPGYWRAAAQFCLGESLPVTATTPELQRAAAARARRRPSVRVSLQVVFGAVLAALTVLAVSMAPDEISGPSRAYETVINVISLLILGWWIVWATRYLVALGGRWPEWLAWRADVSTDGDALVFSLRIRRKRLTDDLPAMARYLSLIYLGLLSMGVIPLYQAWVTRRRRAWLGEPKWRSDAPVDERHPVHRYGHALGRGRGPIVVEIVADYSAEGRALEGALVKQLDREALVNPRLALSRRSGAEPTWPGHPGWLSVRRRGVDVLADPAFERGARQAWAAAGVRRNDGRRGRMASKATTLHVIGDPRETASGWQMAIGDEYISNVRARTTTTETVLFGEQTYAVGPESERHPMRLVVLQPEPCVGVPAIASAPEVMGCRWVARGLAERGHPVVVVLPVVSEEIASDLVVELARRAGRRPLTRKALAKLDLGLRAWLDDRLIADGVDRETVRAVVYDLTLFTKR